MRYVLVLLLFYVSAFSAYYYPAMDVCFSNVVVDQAVVYAVNVSTGEVLSTSAADVDEFVPGYVYYDLNATCVPRWPTVQVAHDLGLDIEDFHFLMGLVGVLFGFVFHFLVNQLFTLVVRRNG